MSWFKDAGLGLFVHWGHYAEAGWEASWPLVGGIFSLPRGQVLDVDVYHDNAAKFCPETNSPEKWVSAAAAAGARYAILTTRHHDGFSMWPTACSDYSIRMGGYQGDPVGEFVTACRKHDMRVGFYYSLPDWKHPDYPAFTEAHKPYQFGQYPAATDQQWNRYINYLKAQLTELLSNYGEIDIIWFDGGWEHSQEDWHCAELEQMIRKLQPNILINDRLPGYGDYTTPEQFIPPTPPEGKWETCLTMNDSWGFNREDTHYKSSTDLIQTLCEVRGRGGNLLLNVGPDGKGNLRKEQADIWRDIALWTQANGDSIFETRPGLQPWQFYGPSTRNKKTLYLHLLMHPVCPITVRSVPVKQVKSIRHLATGTDLPFETHIAIMDMISASDPLGDLKITIPEHCLSDHVTTIAVEFDADF